MKKSKLTPAQEMSRIAVSIGRARRVLAKARTRTAALSNGRGDSESRRLFELAAGAAAVAHEAAYHALLLASNFGVLLLRRDDPLPHVVKLGSELDGNGAP